MRRRVLVALVLTMLSAAPINAQPAATNTGNLLSKICVKKSSYETVCSVYISGVEQGVQLARPNEIICKPPGVEAEQDMDIVIQYIANHPAERHLYGPQLIVKALREAFPCPIR